MFKKLLLVGVVAAVAVVGLKAVGLFNYAKHEVAAIGDWADSKIPPEKKIAQMRKEVDRFDQDIDKAQDELAREIVEVRYLNRQVTELRASVVGEEKLLAERGQAIKDATERVKYGRSTITVAEAKDRLKQDVTAHLKRKQNLTNMEKALEIRERNQEILAKQVDELVRQKQDLKLTIDSIENEYKTLQLQQMESKYQNDNTRLAKVKQGIAKMQKDIEVQKEKLKMVPPVRMDEPQSTSVTGETVDQILAPLNGNAPKAADANSIGKAD